MVAEPLRAWPRLLAFAVLAILTALPVAGAQAQIPLQALAQGKPAEGPDSSGYEALLQQAQRDGSTVIIMQPAGTGQAATPEMPMAMALSSENLLKARESLKRMVVNSLTYVDFLPESLKAASPDGTALWLLLAAATAVGGLVAGRLVFWQVTRWGRGHFRHLYREDETILSRKLGYILFRAGWMLLSAGIMFVTAVLVAVVFDSGHQPSRDTIFVIISTYVVYRIVRSVIFWNFFAPNSSAHRLIHLPDAAAQKLFNHWAIVLSVGAVVIGLCRWILILTPPGSVTDMSMVAVNQDAQNLAFILGMLLCAAMMGALAIIHRRDLTGIVLGTDDPQKAPLLNRVFAVAALPLAIVYLIVAWLVSSVRLTLGLPGGYVPVLAPIIVFVAGIFAYAIAAYLLEIVYERRAASHRRRQILKQQAERRAWRRAQASKELMSAMNEDMRDMLEDGDEMTVMAPVQPPKTQIRPYFPAFKVFFQNTIQATILVVCAGELARLWGLDLGRDGGHPVAAALDILLVVIVALSFYRAINGFIDHKIVEEGGTLDGQAGNPGEGEGEGGKSQSRLATLLPIFRNVIVSLLAVLGTMVVLANLGVDVGPLFAGAGVVGIAVGFGAQTLIRDIFSGAFFLVDDAFRKGEYIEVGSVKGVVEKISMRSFQLRHHLGAVHTVPFGEITQLTNYSRDWVMMKLPLRLTYDTDVEKVRKLVKKIGARLLEDPVVGHLFLQPLKSQGVYAMEDSAMIIRVKFMTRPGDQFVTRKVVYAAIREVFSREGIRFAHREVTVRLADGQKADELTKEQKDAITGSVRAVIDDAQAMAADAGKTAAGAL
ncbi:mechanosensitive ion channel family protein [Aquibium microcysteis]|uniref:mechanosensitive ion channel family protein n=1 Tax=Aquibium microcysteis TaxID=675281 RepID=UPI00165D2DE0|nr:mechanosensitive ion channel family protein [Aquibium microcysteis]